MAGTELRGRMRRLVVGLPFLWLGLFFLVPFVIVARIALSQSAIALPPYTPVLDLSAGIEGVVAFVRGLSFANFEALLADDIYLAAYLQSLTFAAVATAILLVIGFPIAHAMARAPRSWRPVLLVLVILPFWTSFLIRVYAWIGILQREGLLNSALLAVGIIDEPIGWLATDTAVYIGLVYSYLPFMVLPLYAALERIDDTLLEAAADLGAPPSVAFWRVTVPLAIPGVIAGSLLCFIPIVGEVVIPDLLGGSDTLMIGRTLWVEFFQNRDWPLASAVALVLLALLVVPIVIWQNLQARELAERR